MSSGQRDRPSLHPTRPHGQPPRTMDVLAPRQIEHLHTVFSVFAAPVAGEDFGIGARELSSVLHALGVDATEAEVAELVSRADRTGRGALDFDEFVQLMAGELKDTHVDAELVEAFAAFDRDRDGVLSAAEVSEVLGGAGGAGAGAAASHNPANKHGADAALTPADIQSVIFEAAGPRASGITLDQFLEAMKTQQ